MIPHYSFSSFGNVSIDDLIFNDGSTMWRVPGGNAVYSGLGMAVWQERPAVVAPIGPDYPTEGLNDRVDLTHCRLVERTLRDWGLYEEDGSRHFIFRTETKDWLKFSPKLEDTDRFTCDFAHLAPLRWELQVALAERLRSRGTQVVGVDPDDRYLSELGPGDVERLLNAVDLFLPSKQDVEALLPGRSVTHALRELRELAPELPLIAIKCGRQGVFFHAAGAADYLEVPAFADVVVDATGAGDAFSGGTLVGFARTHTGLDAVLFGSVSASYAVASSGPSALAGARLEEANERLELLRRRVDAHAL